MLKNNQNSLQKWHATQKMINNFAECYDQVSLDFFFFKGAT